MLSEFEKFWQHVANKDTKSSGGAIEMGTVGWDDADEHMHLGGDNDDGHTLVKVQLYAGRDYSTPLDPTRAQGHKILCHISGGVFRVPPKGTRVFVAIPTGMESVAGAGVIFASIEPSNASQQLNRDRVVMDFGPDTHVVIKGKSVSTQSYANEFISVGTPRAGGTSGLTFQAADGSGGVCQNGVVSWFVTSGGAAKTIIQMTPAKVDVMCQGGGFMGVNASGFQGFGNSCYVTGGAVYLGSLPTAVTPALWGLTGTSGVASKSVFVSV